MVEQTIYLVTGGAGFIGSNLTSALLARGHSVRILDDFSTGRQANVDSFGGDAEVIRGDIRDPELAKTACADVDSVFHLAALPSVERSVREPAATNDVNITGTLNMLLQARDCGVRRFVMASSSSVYGNTPVLPKHESMTPAPLSPYALSKLTGEHYLRLFHELYGLETFALRYFNVFGPRQDPASDYAAVIPLFIDAARKDRAVTIYGDGGQTRDFTYVDDVVAANLCCCTAPASVAGQAFNVARGDRTSILELARKIYGIMGRNNEPVFQPPRTGDVRDSQADSERARTQLNWTPAVTLDEGLQQTIHWFTKGAYV